MIRAVIDANVIVSGLLGWDRPGNTPATVLRCVVDGECIAVLSTWITDEVAQTLEEPYFAQRLGPERIRALLAIVYRKSELHPIAVAVSGVAPDPDDDPIIATALSGHASYIVTGDAALRSVARFHDVTIVTPREFLDLLRSQN